MGSVFLGANRLAIGRNNQSTSFSGVIQGSGTVAKAGTGTLNLSGSNTYSGGDHFKRRRRNGGNRTGSARGLGAVVKVNAGPWGAAGSSRARSRSGRGMAGRSWRRRGPRQANDPDLQNSLTFKADATYSYRLDVKKEKIAHQPCDSQRSNINSATLDLRPGPGRLKSGLTLTVLSNTTASPIQGASATSRIARW